MVGSYRSREDLCQSSDVSEDHRQKRSSQNNYYHKDHPLLNDKDSHLSSVLRDEGKNEEEEEEEFSFVCTNPSGSLIFAEDIFQNGQIRPIDPLFNKGNNLILSTAEDVRIEVKASSTSASVMFMEDRSIAEGPCCVWTGGSKASRNQQMICKKGSFIRFSKLRRFREFVVRSNVHSQLGKDAVIFFSKKYYSSKYPTTTIPTCKSFVDQEKNKDKDDLVVVKGNRGEQYN